MNSAMNANINSDRPQIERFWTGTCTKFIQQMPLDKQADLKCIETIVLVPDRRVGLEVFFDYIVLNYNEMFIIDCTATCK